MKINDGVFFTRRGEMGKLFGIHYSHPFFSLFFFSFLIFIILGKTYASKSERM